MKHCLSPFHHLPSGTIGNKGRSLAFWGDGPLGCLPEIHFAKASEEPEIRSEGR